ncbi:LOG family protein [Aquimarina agarilytica]|uniref:LOG family protein n=1 Tax=Aquimarina agarilytica TaxID=1087449 RepID=UPI000287DB5E|nr:LOG family protein [Aquimarina agarilytica]
MNYTEIESQEALQQLLITKNQISKYAFQNLDFNSITSALSDITFTDCIFLGCILPNSLVCDLYTENYLFPNLNMPFNNYVNGLYTKETLYNNYILNQPESYKNTQDAIVYEHFLKTGKEANDIKETLGRRLHDHSITDALYGFLDDYPDDKKVAIMGGHGLSRADQGFTTVAQLSKKLTEKGYLMLSGGGPGAMEATHVGAWFAGKTDAELNDAIAILATAPSYKDKLWLDKSFEVLAKYPTSDYESVGIPTWLYGHEPPTPFASKIAKYFANSVREDGLLAIAKGGIVFTPGSAGTIQEIFQDATQNHYLSFEVSSPMIFLNSDYWTKERPVYPLIEKLNNEEKYSNLLLSLCDTKEQVIEQLDAFSIPE